MPKDKESEATLVTDLIIGVAVFVIAWVVPAWLGQRKQDKGNANSVKNNAPNETQQPPKIVLTETIGSETQSPSKKKKWHQNPNNWIKTLTLLFVIAYTGITALIWFVSKDTLKEAKRQADAASRSYVFVTVSGGQTILDWTFDKAIIATRIRLINYGAAPAIIKHVGCVVVWGEPSGPPNDALKVAETESRYSSLELKADTVLGNKDSTEVDCPPGWPINGAGINLGRGPTESIQNRREAIRFHPIWVVGLVEYADVSNAPHSTPFCAMNDGGINLTPGGGPDCRERK